MHEAPSQKSTDKKREAYRDKGKSLLIDIDNFVSIDVETTGLSPRYDEIIELGAVRYRNGVQTESFSSLIKPSSHIREHIVELTGITNLMLESAPDLSVVLPEFLKFVGDDIIVGHCVNFDINFIYDACVSSGLSPFCNDFIDTMRLARRMYKNMPNHQLNTLTSHLGVVREQCHRALDDCSATATCYRRMVGDSELFQRAISVPTRKYANSQGKSLKELVAVGGLENPDSMFYGKVCVFTGTLETFTRKEAAQIVLNIGGVCADNVTKKTNILVLGNLDYCKSKKTIKQIKAEQLIESGADLIILPECEFIEMLQSDYLTL